MHDYINISHIDRSNMLHLLATFPQQFQEARQIGEDFNIAINYNDIKNLIIAGMGGSAIGGDLIISCLNNKLQIPAFVVRNYYLPNFVNHSSLVFISSYSGDTEEALSCYEDARAKKAQIVCISSGGKLTRQANIDGYPIIKIPGGMPPRTALGYLSLPLIVFLCRTKLADENEEALEETEKLLEKKSKLFSPETGENIAYQLAEKLKAKIPIIYSSVDLLHVAGLRWKGQFSENAKVLAFCNVFPELNHNEIVGWSRLPLLKSNFQVIYLRDREDDSRNQRRMNITRRILEQVTSQVIELFTEGDSSLARLFSLLYLGDWVSFYLAIINGIDPTPIEKIQFLKDQLRSSYQ